jgi:hypothetical protein
VPLSSSYDSESVLPLAAVWRRGMAAPDRTSVAARSDPASRVQRDFTRNDKCLHE